MTRFTGSLHPFQIEGVRFPTTANRRLLADDVGLGKTIQIAAAIGALWDPELSDPEPVLPSPTPATVAEVYRCCT